MAKPRIGKQSRKKRRQQREKSERAQQKGLPSRPVTKPAAKRRRSGSSSPAKRTRRRDDPDRDGARRAIDGEPDTVGASTLTIRDRIVRLPPVVKIGAIAALLLIGIWVVAQVRDRGQAPVAAPASQEQIPPRNEPESVGSEVEQLLARQPELALSAAATEPVASAETAALQPTPSASASAAASAAEFQARPEKKKKSSSQATAAAAAAMPDSRQSPKPAAPAPPAVPPKPAPAPKPKPAPAEENPY